MDLSFTKKSALCFFLLFFTTSVAFAQSYQDTDYRKLSLSISGGASLGNVDEGIRFMASSFNVETETTPTFGAGLQYALTPAWSLEVGYQRAKIKGRVEPFETTMNLMTLKNIINLNQIFFINRVSDRLNPFITAGIGYDMFAYDSPETEFDAHNSTYNLGAGLVYKLSNTIDLFTHYEYHIGSNSTDNVVAGFGADLINSLTGGVRINFGKKKSTHPSWRPVPVDVSPSDYNRLISQADLVDDLQRRISEVEQRQEEKEQGYNQIVDQKSAEIDSLKARLSRLNEHVDDLKETFTNALKESDGVKVNNKTGFAESLTSGHYVQIFATHHLETAQEIREHTIQSMDEVLQSSEQKILIIRRKEFYEVMIGVFSNFTHAQDVQKVMVEVHDDAYVITFPRPINLQSQFKGLKVID